MVNPAWGHLAERFESLLAQPLEPATAPDLLRQWTHLNRAVYQERGQLIRAYYAHSTDAPAKDAHDAFVRDHFPKLAAASAEFLQRIVAAGVNYPDEWRPFVQSLPNQPVSEEVLALQGEENQLGKAFQQIRASTVYQVNGQEVQPGTLAAKLQHPDREERRSAYLGLIGSEHTKDEELNDLFLRLHGIRTQMAQAAGYSTYYDYALQQGPLRHKAYSARDTASFRESVKKHVVPLFLELRALRKRSLGLSELRPWDTMLNPFGVTPMAQFGDEADIFDRTAQVLERLDPEFRDIFDQLRVQGLLDIESRPDKARNGYSSILPVTQQPFILLHMGPRAFNIHLLFHELGHAVHYAVMPKGQPYEVYAPPLEFAEFIAQTVELLTAPLLHSFFEENELFIVHYLLLERVCFEIVNMCKLDEFQERLYSQQHLSKEDLIALYDDIDAQYPTGMEWGDAAFLRPYFWKNFTLFSSPFYRFEYAVAWVAALQFQNNFQHDPTGALGQFKSAMQLGFTRSPKELFKAAGIDLHFDEKTLRDTAHDLRMRLMVK